MKNTLSKKQRFFDNINLTTDDDVYVGIDVHKKNWHIAIWLNDAIAHSRHSRYWCSCFFAAAVTARILSGNWGWDEK